jgi:nucleotide-binding universal stress UspA family protein
VGQSIRSAVVGVDGSAASMAARAWAETVADVHEVHVDDGDVAAVLLRRAADAGADLIVVGMHEQRRAVLRSLGPVVSELLRNADRPIVVVGAEHTAARSGQTVVVGVGHGPATDAAVRWAAGFASDHDATLDLIRAVPQRPVFRADGLLDVLAYYVDPSMAADWARDDVQAIAAAIDRLGQDGDGDGDGKGEGRRDNGGVATSWSTAPGSTGPVLVDAATHADLLVVGLHDRPGADDHHVAPWCRRVLLHAPCPVVFVPAERASTHR